MIQLHGVQSLAPAWAASSINVPVFRQQSILRLADGSHSVAYYDSVGKVRVDTLGPSGELHSAFVAPAIDARLLGDGHCSISLGRSADGVVHVMYGAHDTVPLYAQIDERDLLDGVPGQVFAAVEWGRRISYPQFYQVGQAFELWFRSDPQSEVHRTRYDPSTRTLPLTSQVLLVPGSADRVYMNQLAARGGRVALSFMYRLFSVDNIVRNEGLHLLLSRDAGENWHSPKGASVALPLVKDGIPPLFPLGADLQPLNQTSSFLAFDGFLFVTWYAKDATGIHQIFLGTIDAEETLVEVSTVSRNLARYDLLGRGTLLLPLSRPQVVASRDYVHVIYRQDDRIVIASKPAVAGCTPWRYLEVDAGPLGAWEPSLSADSWVAEDRLLVYVQGARQGPLDTALPGSPTVARVYEFREIGRDYGAWQSK